MEEVLAEELDDEEQLVRRHRKEKKELQAKIQGMKNAVPKNDKKRRKQLTEDVAKLEREMEQKHREELQQLKLTFKDSKPGMVIHAYSPSTQPQGGCEFKARLGFRVRPLSQNPTVATEKEVTGKVLSGLPVWFTSIDSVADNISNLVLENQPPRISKAQKRREKKAALEKEREERIAEAEIENLSGARHLESEKLAQILAARELEIKHIPSDGHCMYGALEDQLRGQDCALTVAALRKQTAEYMQSHSDDFLPFLTNPSTGDVYTPEEFGKYCDDIVNTAAWGGQLELRALSHILQTPIEILQADAPPIIVGEEYPRNPLVYLTLLNLGNNLLQEVSEEIKYLTSLKNLHLFGNRICRIAPGVFDGLPRLILLNLNDNKLTSLPQEIGRSPGLRSLTYLSLNHNNLTVIPTELCSLEHLSELHLNYNQITHIPEEIKHLQKLQQLFLVRNNIEELPKEICRLAKLRVLDIAGNVIQIFPAGEIAARFVLSLLEEKDPLIMDAIESYPEVKEKLSKAKKCSICRNPFLSEWLECVYFVTPSK
ncbi:Deubiquitinase OTUD6B [Apodemus speciosus]|uniref:Deubiquitinase OTUD6B n=1 Tax=Apodemus speciosus TaxID=105296 RepID=A0ABQ0ENG8_APOSI